MSENIKKIKLYKNPPGMSYEYWTTVLMVAEIMTYLLICYDDIINVMSKLLVKLNFIFNF